MSFHYYPVTAKKSSRNCVHSQRPSYKTCHFCSTPSILIIHIWHSHYFTVILFQNSTASFALAVQVCQISSVSLSAVFTSKLSVTSLIVSSARGTVERSRFDDGGTRLRAQLLCLSFFVASSQETETSVFNHERVTTLALIITTNHHAAVPRKLDLVSESIPVTVSLELIALPNITPYALHSDMRFCQRPILSICTMICSDCIQAVLARTSYFYYLLFLATLTRDLTPVYSIDLAWMACEIPLTFSFRKLVCVDGTELRHEWPAVISSLRQNCRGQLLVHFFHIYRVVTLKLITYRWECHVDFTLFELNANKLASRATRSSIMFVREGTLRQQHYIKVHI